MVQEWFINKGTYKQGLQLLKQVSTNKHIYIRLKNKKPSQRNMAALKYELNKYRNTTIVAPKTVKQTSFKKTASTKVQDTIIKSVKQSNQKITMAMLGNAQIRSRFVEKNKAFYQRWELKKQLNELPEGSEEKALHFIYEIMKLTDLIDTIWREIDYYLEHKQCMPSADDFNDLNTDELRNIRQKLYQKRTKRITTLNKWKADITTITISKQLALQSKIDKQTETITRINLNIEKLNKLTPNI